MCTLLIPPLSKQQRAHQTINDGNRTLQPQRHLPEMSQEVAWMRRAELPAAAEDVPRRLTIFWSGCAVHELLPGEAAHVLLLAAAPRAVRLTGMSMNFTACLEGIELGRVATPALLKTPRSTSQYEQNGCPVLLGGGRGMKKPTGVDRFDTGISEPSPSENLSRVREPLGSSAHGLREIDDEQEKSQDRNEPSGGVRNSTQ